MPSLRTWATPLTIGSFILVAVTGLLMFFLDGRIGLVKPAHEFLSLVFVAGALAHISVHWTAIKTHLKKKWGRAIVVAFATITLLVLLPIPIPEDADEEKPPFRASMELLLDAPLHAVVQLKGDSLKDVLALLKQEGLMVIDASNSITEIAKQNKKSPEWLLGRIIHPEG